MANPVACTIIRERRIIMREAAIDALRNRLLVADGAIGTELQRRGLEPGACAEAWNIEHPDQVEGIHSSYVQAGARFLTTNSFRGTRHALAAFGWGDRARELNHRAAHLAKAAAGDRAWVLGSIGPFGGFLEPLGDTTREQLHSWFLEQAEALLEGGADGIVLETMAAKEEVEVGIQAAQAAGASLVVAMMTFEKGRDGCRTMMGVSPGNAAKLMTDAGAHIVGTNCGTGLLMTDYAEIASRFRSAVDVPVVVRPNAGSPVLVGERVVYSQPPAEMAAEVVLLAGAGANIIGGCCGTTPEHIRAFAGALDRVPDPET
jgi:5-methyltetrahydrofolate--homocysteine methyltransferase